MDNEIDVNSPGDFDNVKLNPSNVINRPKLTFFYQRPNGDIFATEEQEAATAKLWTKFAYVGWSNGTTHAKIIREANLKMNQLVSKEDAEKLLKKAFEAELVVAKENMKNAKLNQTPIVRPVREDWHFDGSVPMNERDKIRHT